MNASALAGSCESQVFGLGDEVMTASGGEAETSTSSASWLWLVLLNIILFIHCIDKTFMKDIGLLMAFLWTWA